MCSSSSSSSHFNATTHLWWIASKRSVFCNFFSFHIFSLLLFSPFQFYRHNAAIVFNAILVWTNRQLQNNCSFSPHKHYCTSFLSNSCRNCGCCSFLLLYFYFFCFRVIIVNEDVVVGYSFGILFCFRCGPICHCFVLCCFWCCDVKRPQIVQIHLIWLHLLVSKVLCFFSVFPCFNEWEK